MSITEGTYIVVNAAATSMAMDVSGGSDANGASITIYPKNGTHAQYVMVVGDSTYQEIRFPLSGRCLSVPSSNTSNGTTMVQWDSVGSDNQRWNIVADGSTVTIGGTSYPTYNIKSKLSASKMVSTSGTSAGSNVTITSTSSTQRRWAFIPVTLLPKGKYRFISALDQKTCLTSANSKDGSIVKTAGIDLEDNRQVWQVLADGSVTYIRNHESKMYATAKAATAESNVIQNAKKTNNGKWLLTTSGTMKFNGDICPLVVFNLVEGSNLALDASDGTQIKTNATVRALANKKGQKFVAVPTLPVDKTIPAPSSVLLSKEVGGIANRNASGTGKVTRYLTWMSDYRNYQIRKRYRTRKATSGNDTFSEWSAWYSPTKSTANNGWGDVTKPNCTPTLAKNSLGNSRRYGSTITFNLTPTGYDLAEYQYTVRAVTSNARGAASTVTGRFAYQPTFTLNSITLTPRGLQIAYQSDQKRNSNDLVIYKVTCVHSNKTKLVFDGGEEGFLVSDLRWKDTAEIPLAKLDYIPSVGDVVTAKIRFTNVDGAYKYSKQTVSATLSYGQGQGLVINPTASITVGKMLHVEANVADADKYTLWVDYGDDFESFRKFGDSDGTWDVPILFGIAFRVWVMVEKGNSWDVYSKSMDAVDDPGTYLFNFVNASGEQDWLQVRVNLDEPPVYKRSISWDSNTQNTNGDAYQVVHFGYGQKESMNVHGIIPTGKYAETNSTIAKCEQLLKAHYAWLRRPRDNRAAYRVAVTGINFDLQSSHWTKVDIALTRVNTPTEW